MTQRTDQQHLSELIGQLESNLKELREILDRYPQPKSRLTKKQRRAKSLYGIFPHTNAAWEDFRDARRSWSRRLGNF